MAKPSLIFRGAEYSAKTLYVGWFDQIKILELTKNPETEKYQVKVTHNFNIEGYISGFCLFKKFMIILQFKYQKKVIELSDTSSSSPSLPPHDSDDDCSVHEITSMKSKELY